ncbi:MAG: hypothetical protein EAZ47_09565 [Bacteroidetes bacterium]|nr:MAG: hypothetical protein EAY72_09225 [Bacteroidota bacterium]TAE72811.1 MAG: hypothetical protein EAY68_00265 [Bacteroidota bacterium]TAF91681.1 MAG: hypothetical protein EAZ47_09565 [Bacteroidota bacterium]
MFLFTSLSCRKQCTNASYEYQTKFNVLGSKNIFKVGDSIHFELTINSCDFEFIRNQTVCLKNVRTPVLNFGILGFDSTQMVTGAKPHGWDGKIDHFTIHYPQQKFWLTSIPIHNAIKRHMELTPDTQGAAFTLKFSILCNKKGFYYLGAEALATHVLDMPCQTYAWNIIMNAPLNQMQQMLGISNWPTLPQLNVDRFFYFKVI